MSLKMYLSRLPIPAWVHSREVWCPLQGSVSHPENTAQNLSYTDLAEREKKVKWETYAGEPPNFESPSRTLFEIPSRSGWFALRGWFSQASMGDRTVQGQRRSEGIDQLDQVLDQLAENRATKQRESQNIWKHALLGSKAVNIGTNVEVGTIKAA